MVIKLLRRSISGLPQLRVDGTRLVREPYPLYSKYTLLAGTATLAGFLAAGEYIYPQFPRHPYTELLKDVSYRGMLVTGSLTLAFPVLLVVYRRRSYWIYRGAPQYVATLVGLLAYFKYVELFPNEITGDIMAQAFGTTSAVTLSALLSPLAKDGWFMTAMSSSLLVFTLTWALSKGYFHNIMYESKAAKWQRELEMKNLLIKNNIEGASSP
ncbi:unnamed protein product [Oikopleura dioica]|uniref:Uncharacterized protein n=1 Tax=Oikopleura dioica TaxID=34765 RepID=E4Z536_OIKDI|nr:unnamed protein product [Oikopleura dioica]